MGRVYYLAGYAVECGLKACVVDFVEKNPGIIYEKRGFSDACWTHKLSDLIVVAGLSAACDADGISNPAFEQNWAEVIKWHEASRYVFASEVQARKLFDAISHPQDGVMKWIRDHW